jgi:hypothetical protein
MYLDPNGFASALAAERGTVGVAPGVVAIALKRKGGRTGQFALVSYEDRALGYGVYWSPSRWGYARRRLKDGSAEFMHRVIMGCVNGDGLIVDHINRDKLDNRRENLRFVTQAQNAQNQDSRYGTSGHRGVSYRSRDKKWVVMHGLGGRAVYGGSFDTEEEAIEVARAWRAKHYTHSGDSSPHRNVSWDKARGKWKVQIRVNGKNTCVGRYDTQEEADRVAAEARRKHYPFSED